MRVYLQWICLRMKTCCDCLNRLPLAAFYKQKGRPLKRCKRCHNVFGATRRTWYRMEGRCLCGQQRAAGRKLCKRCLRRFKDRYHRRSKNDASYVRKLRDASVQRSKALKMAALAAYGGCLCVCCGETHVEFLTIDHINKPLKDTPRSGKSFYQWLKTNNYPTGFRVLCLNCNFALGHYGYCPHGCYVDG